VIVLSKIVQTELYHVVPMDVQSQLKDLVLSWTFRHEAFANEKREPVTQGHDMLE
jgi:predicted lipid carrier protein YhbT